MDRAPGVNSVYPEKMFSRQSDDFFASPLVLWRVVGISVFCTALAFTFLSKISEFMPVFGILPITWVVIVGTLSGSVFLMTPGIVRRLSPSLGTVIAMIGVGLVSRLVLFASEPLWEIDYLRYLWDGGMLANGLNTYLWSPHDILSGNAPATVLNLAVQANGLVEQINYPELRSIYPPLGAALFAVAHFVGEWSLMTWRLVLLIFDLSSLVLLLLLLQHLDRSPLWAAIYWWNPLVIQMFFNAAHMDALLIPALLAALLFAVRLRPVISNAFLAVAVGIKLWPVLLLPSLLRHGNTPIMLRILALCLFVTASLAVLLPMASAGFDHDSGLTAFAISWNTNSAILGTMERFVTQAMSDLGLYEIDASMVVRTAAACILIAVSLLLARRTSRRADQLCHRMLIMTALLFLLSPAAYPWYASWFIAFLVLSPNGALLVWTVTLPLYHLRFHPFFMENPVYFENGVVWLEHGPVVVLLIWQWFGLRRASAA